MNISKHDLLLAALAHVGPQEKYLEEERQNRMLGAGRQTTESKQKLPTPLPPTEQAAAPADNADAK